MIDVNIPTYNFDRNSKKYRCCCGCMHVTLGASIIGIIELLCCLATLAFDFAYPGSRGGLIGGNVFWILLTILFVGMMFYGIQYESHSFLTPHLVYQAIQLVFLMIGGIMVIVIYFLWYTKNEETIKKIRLSNGTDITEYVFIGAGIMLLIMAIFQIWFLIVVKNCKNFLYDKALHDLQPVIAQYYNSRAMPPVYHNEAAEMADEEPPPAYESETERERPETASEDGTPRRSAR